jgi:hypothetical protein
LLAEPELAGLLYRADWTQLTLSAEVMRVTGPGHEGAGWPGARTPRLPWISPGQPSEDPGGGPYRVTGRLLVAPGRRYRLETTGDDGQKFLEGCDGDRPWCRMSQPEDGSSLQFFGGPQPPEPELLHPSWLLTGFDLGPADAVVVGGRDGYRLVATARPSPVLGQRPWGNSDEAEVVVDAELGILLRCERRSGGHVVLASELSGVVSGPSGAVDPAQFAAPAGSVFSESNESLFGAPFGPMAKSAASVGAGLLAGVIRYAAKRAPSAGPGETIPHGEDEHDLGRPAADTPAAGDDLVYRLYRAGRIGSAFTAEYHQWFDPAVLATMARTGPAIAVILSEAIGEIASVEHRISRIQVFAPDRFRIDHLSGGDGRILAIACDGQRGWREYPDHVTVGPAATLPDDLARLLDPRWLLTGQLSGGEQVTVSGRSAFRIRRAHRANDLPDPGSLGIPARAFAVLDADLGVLLSLARYPAVPPPGAPEGTAGPLTRQELRGVSTAHTDGPDFDADVPPGVRVVEDAGDLFGGADAPGVLGFASRTVSGATRWANYLRGRQ